MKQHGLFIRNPADIKQIQNFTTELIQTLGPLVLHNNTISLISPYIAKNFYPPTMQFVKDFNSNNISIYDILIKLPNETDNDWKIRQDLFVYLTLNKFFQSKNINCIIYESQRSGIDYYVEYNQHCFNILPYYMHLGNPNGYKYNIVFLTMDCHYDILVDKINIATPIVHEINDDILRYNCRILNSQTFDLFNNSDSNGIQNNQNNQHNDDSCNEDDDLKADELYDDDEKIHYKQSIKDGEQIRKNSVSADNHVNQDYDEKLNLYGNNESIIEQNNTLLSIGLSPEDIFQPNSRQSYKSKRSSHKSSHRSLNRSSHKIISKI